MKRGTFRALVAAAGLLTLVFVGWQTLGRGISSADASEVGAPFGWVSMETVDSVTLRNATGTHLLRREGDGWSIDGWRADPGVTARFWADALDSRLVEVASHNPDNHSRMGVAGEGTLEITLHTPLVSRSILVGEPGTGFATTFVRRPGDDEVHVVDADLRAHVMRSLDAWRDRTMVSLDPDQVTGLSIERPGHELFLTRDDDEWAFVDGDGTVDVDRVEEVLAALRDLRATGFLTSADDLAAVPEAARLTVVGAAGVDEPLAVLTFGEAVDGARWVRVAGDHTLWRLSASRADRLLPSTDEVRSGG